MHLDVVGMAVAAVPVVDRQDVRRFLAQDVGQSTGRLVEVGQVERERIGVLLPTGHAGVGVPEPHHPGDAEDVGRCLDLQASPIDERLAGSEIVGNLSVVAVRPDDEHHAVTFGGGAGDRAAGAARFVVRMGVETHDRRHVPPVCQGDRSPSLGLGRAVAARYSACRTAPDASSSSTRSVVSPQSASTSRVCAPAYAGGRSISGVVRLNRGAGAGWTTPSISTNV